MRKGKEIVVLMTKEEREEKRRSVFTKMFAFTLLIITSVMLYQSFYSGLETEQEGNKYNAPLSLLMVAGIIGVIFIINILTSKVIISENDHSERCRCKICDAMRIIKESEYGNL